MVGHKENGDPIFRYVSAGSQKELMNKLRRDMEEYRAVELTEGSQMTLGEWLDRWPEEYMAPTIRDTSLPSYRRYIDCHIKPRSGYKKISRVTADDVRKIHGVFHQAMGAAMREEFVARNPTEGVALPKKRPPVIKTLNNEQLERFMEEIKKDEVWHDFFYTELTTGLHRGELLGLRWDDLDMETGTLKIDRQIYPVKGKLIVNEPKTKAAVRTIILPPPMLEVLKEYKEQVFSPWLFPSRIKPEQPIDPGYIRKRLQVIRERAGCKRVRFHDLRHT